MNVIIVLMDTLRRDYISCYEAADKSHGLAKPVETPNLDRLAANGTLMLEAFLGSSPCMPARRELWTGRYEFPWRGWGPLEDDDLDLFSLLRSHGYKTALISDHYHLLERDAGNYTSSFTEWDMIRGQEHDPYPGDPSIRTEIDHLTSPVYQDHLQNLRGNRRQEEELYAARVFRESAAWLERNATRTTRNEQPFCLFVECFDPHEPWDPPAYIVESFDPGYRGREPFSPSYGPSSRFSEDELRHMRALYAAELTVVDRWFGHLLAKIDQLGLWEDTMIVATTDHGFYLGERGLVGKPDRVPLFPEMSRIPLLMYVPGGKAGERRKELCQLIDIGPTMLEALGVAVPIVSQVEAAGHSVVGAAGRKAWEGIGTESVRLHGRSLLPLLNGESVEKDRVVCTAKYGDVVRITDGEWTLYLPPIENELFWYGLRAPGRLFGGRRGTLDRVKGRYPVKLPDAVEAVRLYHVRTDREETVNVVESAPEELARMKRLFAEWLRSVGAPQEMAARYGVAD